MNVREQESQQESPETETQPPVVTPEEVLETPSQEPAEPAPSVEAESEPVEEAVSEKEEALEEVAEPSKPDAEAPPQEPKGELGSFERFKDIFEHTQGADNQLRLTLDFMQMCLAQSGTPRFKDFWEAKKFCIPLFKERMPGAARTELWAQYSLLSKEVKRLKEVLDEQSQFAVEQIDVAIQALEKEVEELEANLGKGKPLEIEVLPEALQKEEAFYRGLQQQLNFLTALGSQIHSLRKELVKTDMRIRQKNKLFQRLSEAGDKIFPPRKEKVKTLSQAFIQDVKAFIDYYFSDEEVKGHGFFLREQIKQLQAIAKVMTLNTKAFSESRQLLSGCWDRLRENDKERRKVYEEKQGFFEENKAKVEEKIQAFSQKLADEGLSLTDADSALAEISQFMRDVELGREQVKALRESIDQAKAPLQAQREAEEAERKQREEERLKQRLEEVETLNQKAQQLIESAQTMKAEELETERDQLLQAIRGSQLLKQEKQVLERSLRPLRELVIERREQELMDLSDDDKESLRNFKEVLRQRKERRSEIKKQLEAYRKAQGSAGLDFEKSMEFNERMEQEKEKLEKVDQGIAQIELRLKEVRARAKG